MLAEQRGDLRTMVDGMLDGLNHHDADRSIIGPTVKMEYLIQLFLIYLLDERDQRLS